MLPLSCHLIYHLEDLGSPCSLASSRFPWSMLSFHMVSSFPITHLLDLNFLQQENSHPYLGRTSAELREAEGEGLRERSFPLAFAVEKRGQSGLRALSTCYETPD